MTQTNEQTLSRIDALDKAYRTLCDLRLQVLAVHATIQHEAVAAKVLDAGESLAEAIRAIDGVLWELDRV